MSVEAHRTLVKSPPELWAELSDAEGLARRLEPFGEIRITRLEPESTVTWEGERARGTVRIEPSGWGTRVTLTAEAAPEPEPVGRPEPALEPAAPDPEPEPVSEIEDLPQTTAALGQDGRLDAPPAPGRRHNGVGAWWARLLPWRPWAAAEETAPEPRLSPEPDPVPDPAEPVAPAEPEVLPVPEPPFEPAAHKIEPNGNGAVRPAYAGELDEVLSAVLDDLGSAHHRPFSRG